MATAELFRALGDPTRFKMIQKLSSGSPYTITTLSDGFSISRQGARKHLQLLVDANIVSLESKGRDTAVYLEMETLKSGEAYIAELGALWDSRLVALRRLVDAN